MNDKNYSTNKVFETILNTSYKYGFITQIDNEIFPPGINKKTLKLLLRIKAEPKFLWRLRMLALNNWKLMKPVFWSRLNLPIINYNEIQIYSRPQKIQNKKKPNAEKILETFSRLGVDLQTFEKNKKFAVEAIFDSVSIGSTFRRQLEKLGVIFCSISEANIMYSNIIQKYISVVVSSNDNFFSTLNTAIFSDGSFCYIPKGINCPFELSTYFRMNNPDAGQFERTLIITEAKSKVKYLEGCTAPMFKKNQLHAAVVELVALPNSIIQYSTIQNWYSGNDKGVGGVFNFVTKRGLCLGKKSQISWTQIETGSALTWKYPSCILLGNKAIGEFYSVALTTNFQEADTGTKMLHFGKNTKSRVISKGISTESSKNTYRGLIQVGLYAKGTINYSQCDSLLLTKTSSICTFPTLQAENRNIRIEHEASVSKFTELQVFYLNQRGLNTEDAFLILITGFCTEVFKELPNEFAMELDQLLHIKLEGTIG